MGGRAALKRKIAEAVPLPPATLALNTAALDEIAAAKAEGREVWPASASDELAVAPIAQTMGAAANLAAAFALSVSKCRFGSELSQRLAL